MAWSKIIGHEKKPLKWWYHKTLCEFGWLIRYKDDLDMYYHHLNGCLKQGFNLYGEKTNLKKVIRDN